MQNKKFRVGKCGHFVRAGRITGNRGAFLAKGMTIEGI